MADADVTAAPAQEAAQEPYSRLIGEVRVVVDSADAELLASHPWRCESARSKFYIRRHTKVAGKSKTIYLHRAVIGEVPDGKVVDHINGNTFDNRRANLRLVTVGENCQNLQRAKTTSKSGVLGVNWHKRAKKWRTQIRLNHATIHIGYFDTVAEASDAYLDKKRQLHPANNL